MRDPEMAAQDPGAVETVSLAAARLWRGRLLPGTVPGHVPRIAATDTGEGEA